MLEAAKALSTEYDMLPRGGAVLCAVSGGADSMCLLHLLHTWAEEGGFRVCAAHYHHGMRGEAADADAAFVSDWCAGRGIPCVVERGEVYAEAERRGLGVEETGRQLRYEFLRRTAAELGCDRIATAHNADDNLETLLLHLARGAGLHGLAGIPPRRGEIVRPLLTTPRAAIEAYLEARQIPHVEDATNTDEYYARNRIRRQVVPVLRQLNPRLTESAAETMGYLRADNDYLNAQAAAVCQNARWAEDDLVIEARHIAQLPAAIAPRAVRRLLEMMGDGSTNCSAAHLKAVVELARPSSLYITDEVDTLPLTWSLANFNGDGKEFRLVITNNTTSAVQGTGVNAENQSGSFTMNIADVANGYRDTYTVEVAAKNATDSTWSYDSFVLYVYDRAALQQFVVDGEDTANGSAITLSNGEKEYIQGLIDSQNSTAAQQAVWDTGRDISLTRAVAYAK